MGVSLGSRPGFMKEIASIGFTSFAFAALAILGSIVVVYPLTRKYLVGVKLREEDDR